MKIKDLGLIQYPKAWEYQTEIHQQLILEKRSGNVKNPSPHVLIFCEHPHVFTLGKSGDEAHLKVSEDLLSEMNAEFFKINRGGDITYHGPGQLVVYPIFDLDRLQTDVHWYIRSLEEVIIRTLAHFGLQGERVNEYTGVWVGANSASARKICAIGVHLSRWVSLHGLAFNVNTNLNYFNHIVPCGINDSSKSVTSLEKELGKKVLMENVKEILLKQFVDVFGLELMDTSNETELNVN